MDNYYIKSKNGKFLKVNKNNKFVNTENLYVNVPIDASLYKFANLMKKQLNRNGCIIDKNGNKEWYKNGKLHRDNDLPARIITDNEDKHGKRKEWYQNGFLNRDNDLPSIEYDNGNKVWYKDDEAHRDNDLPAALFLGSKRWYQNGKLHRDNDLPAAEDEDGSQEWYQNGQLHRDGDLPARIVKTEDGIRKEWYQNGVFVGKEEYEEYENNKSK